MSAPGYSRGERHHLRQLLLRAAHLRDRTEGRADLSYDRLELAAIRLVLEIVIAEARGPLPDDLERLRASIWSGPNPGERWPQKSTEP
jgi:hypothetical protein